MLRESFLNSLERLKKYLAKIYRQKQTTFTVTALDAILMIRLFPFNVKKSKDGTYYIINENEFSMFLKLLINENYDLMSDEKIIKLRNILIKELMGWSPDGIVVDAKFVFDLIKNDNIPSGDIEDQKFIKMAGVLEEKVTFKIVKKNEIEEEKIKENLFKNLKEIYILFQTKKYFIDIKDLLKIILMIEKDKNPNEEFLDKEFEKFRNKIKEKQSYETVSAFIESFNIFTNVYFTTDNKILICLNLDKFIILEES